MISTSQPSPAQPSQAQPPPSQWHSSLGCSCQNCDIYDCSSAHCWSPRGQTRDPRHTLPSEICGGAIVCLARLERCWHMIIFRPNSLSRWKLSPCDWRPCRAGPCCAVCHPFHTKMDPIEFYPGGWWGPDSWQQWLHSLLPTPLLVPWCLVIRAEVCLVLTVMVQ